MPREKEVKATIKDNFQAQQLSSIADDEWYAGTPQPVLHNGARTTFTLRLRNDPPSVGLCYMDGPQERINLKFSVKVIDDSDPFLRARESFAPPMELGRGEMGTVAVAYELADDSSISVKAILQIPECAFDDPELKHQASTVDPAFEPLYREINTPVDTNPAFNFDRFDFISSDEQHFYVHKRVLGVSSEAFRLMFDFDKPEDAQFQYIRDGFIKLENLDGAALKELFTFAYLGHTTREFHKRALQVIDGADMYGLEGLMVLCEKELTAQAKNLKKWTVFQDNLMLLKILDASHTRELPELTETCTQTLEAILMQPKNISADVLSCMIEVTTKHKHHELTRICENKLVHLLLLLKTRLAADAETVLHLVSIATKHDLKNLMGACARWFSKNWNKLVEDGELDGLMEDKTNGLLPCVIGYALSLAGNE